MLGPPLQSLVPAVPARLATLIAQMVEIDEEKRPASTLLIKQELQALTVSAPAVAPLPPARPSVPQPPPGTLRRKRIASRSDAQVIYIRPTDDLWSVREQLDKTPASAITLVFPSETQLRSHVAWKLLHARARDLGKDILIVSADSGIRSVATAVHFRVAASLDFS